MNVTLVEELFGGDELLWECFNEDIGYIEIDFSQCDLDDSHLVAGKSFNIENFFWFCGEMVVTRCSPVHLSGGAL